jgi:MAP/microtubule affinity-regulating kinase
VKSGIYNGNRDKVAIKIYEKVKLNDPMRRKNVEREVQILKKLDHPNIIKLIRTIETPTQVLIYICYDQLNLIMEYGGGVSLKEYVKAKGGKLPDADVKDIMRQLLSAIAFMHQNGIVHRDIKLDNILLDEAKRVKLIDFGFSILYDNARITIFCGTPSYMAPEIIQKAPNYTTGVDVWAAGVIMYYLIAGVLPFRGKNEKELFKKITSGVYEKQGGEQQSNLMEKLLNVNQNTRVTALQVHNLTILLKASQDTWISPIDIKHQILELKRY